MTAIGMATWSRPKRWPPTPPSSMKNFFNRATIQTCGSAPAKAHGNVAHIWELVGRHEKAGTANRRAGELLQRLTTQYPDRPEYLAALAANFNRIGLVDWSLDRPIAAEPAWRQAWEIWTELAERFPQEPVYQDGVADMLSNLGAVCYFTDRFDEAEEYYRRAEAITENCPRSSRTRLRGWRARPAHAPTRQSWPACAASTIARSSCSNNRFRCISSRSPNGRPIR